ncbi:hypothetical protein D0Z07_2285 [Hyphodiscus hymeniophilus]|uniref:SGNH hydrolase-type esterase domain-containing protein n=1 Tax=Hyphodiscus hymeniophilus TaxID=353542 RepID=A0A9P6VM81_9HELO|nr:hypothetical protein D0Z07_2285 [Hyphodiscus hymeniophilus]
MEVSSPRPPLSILCFGDSLTEGYSQFGLSMTPYSKTLKTILLDTNAWSKSKIEIVTDGVSGDRVVHGQFKDRMDKQILVQILTLFASARALLITHFRSTTNLEPLDTGSTTSKPLYNYTLFLGGTNDLGWGLPASEIWSSIKTMTAIPLRHNSKLVLFTVPECGVKNRDLDARRDELNRLIKADDREGVYVFDLHSAMPYHSMSEQEREEVWDDGLHFTPRGYEVMGEFVTRRMLEIIESEEKQGNGVSTVIQEVD